MKDLTPHGPRTQSPLKVSTVQPEADSPDHHRERSEFIRKLVQRRFRPEPINERFTRRTPGTIVQFWHNLGALPDDVKECIASWSRWEAHGLAHRLFDECSARAFIGRSLGARYASAFDRCYHPAMQADYFRLCYLFVEGGFYVDADDVCVGTDILWLFEDGRLKVQPLCYDIASGTMVSPSVFLCANAYSANWIFYVNNNPLIAQRSHPIIAHALAQATALLEQADGESLPEIQSTTGPGNLSRTIFSLTSLSGSAEGSLLILLDWESIAISRWPLSYRQDSRNWRIANQQKPIVAAGGSA
jgi:hypothetical protein